MKFATLMGVAAADELIAATEYKFMEFITSYGRSYATKAEYNFRLTQFAKRVAEHKRWNAQPGVTSTQGVNHLTDRTDEEISLMLGHRPNLLSKGANLENFKSNSTVAAAATPIDWRTKGAVTPVKDQGHCGSCWSFSTTGSMEGQHFLTSGTLLSLSESQLVDCSWLNHGCNGGNASLAFMYAEHDPLETETDYPYVAKSGLFQCKYKKELGKVKVTSWSEVGVRNPDNFKAALVDGPVSVAVEAD